MKIYYLERTDPVTGEKRLIHTSAGEVIQSLSLTVITEQLKDFNAHGIDPNVEIKYEEVDRAATAEYIVCAAVWVNDGRQYVYQPKNIESGMVVCGLRHHNCYQMLSRIISLMDFTKHSSRNEGFLTSHDRFVSREEAYTIAKASGQIAVGAIHDHNPSLDSSELY